MIQMLDGVGLLSMPKLTVVYRLLDTLSGRIEKKGIEGEVLVNGQKMPGNFNRTTGYVIQV